MNGCARSKAGFRRSEGWTAKAWSPVSHAGHLERKSRMAIWAGEVVDRCVERGVLMFSPVGFGGGTVKISPPLVITEAAVLESVAVLEEVFAEATSKKTEGASL